MTTSPGGQGHLLKDILAHVQNNAADPTQKRREADKYDTVSSRCLPNGHHWWPVATFALFTQTGAAMLFTNLIELLSPPPLWGFFVWARKCPWSLSWADV